jgi:hypothetical protein
MNAKFCFKLCDHRIEEWHTQIAIYIYIFNISSTLSSLKTVALPLLVQINGIDAGRARGCGRTPASPLNPPLCSSCIQLNI